MGLLASLYQGALSEGEPNVHCETVAVSLNDLPGRIDQIRTDRDALGAAVMMPCAVAAAGLLDGLGPEAQAIKAVNVISHRAGALIGWNTDKSAFAQALEEAGFPSKGQSVLLLGAGGAARSCAEALREGAEKIWVAAPDLDQARSVARDLQLSAGGPTPLGSLALLVKKVDLIVNATPVGSDGTSVVFPVEWIAPTQFVFDLICQPALTPLVRGARERGARAINGLSMLLYQGLAAFEIWMGRPAPEPAMRAALERAVLQRLGA
jgi:shikimate dehydrogenase